MNVHPSSFIRRLCSLFPIGPSEFRNLVSGRQRGPWASALRCGLRVAEAPYTWAVRWRNHRYDTGAAPIHRVGVPVVSVGNLTLGGTGKTPMVEWIARWFADRGVAVGLVSRGYGTRSGCLNDEALELQWNLPGVPHLQNPDRVAAARTAIDEFHCRVIVLDDAFQHRRIGRNMDLVLLDALEPLGFGHVFPRGTLREPLEGLGRADLVALSRADLLSADERQRLRGLVEPYAPQAAWLEIAHTARSLLASDRSEQPLTWLAGQRVLAFCGIGNPAGFRHTLATCGCQVAGFHEFPDHHDYKARDLDLLATSAVGLDVAALVCTRKDLVKLGVDRLGDRPLRAVRIAPDILTGREILEARLAALLG